MEQRKQVLAHADGVPSHRGHKGADTEVMAVSSGNQSEPQQSAPLIEKEITVVGQCANAGNSSPPPVKVLYAQCVDILFNCWWM